MVELNCDYLNYIDHQSEKQRIFYNLQYLEKDENIAALLKDFSKFSLIYDEAIAAGLQLAIQDYIIIIASAPNHVINSLQEYLKETNYSAWGHIVSKDHMLWDFISEYKWKNLDIETFDAMRREN